VKLPEVKLIDETGVAWVGDNTGSDFEKQYLGHL
jgi:hypothetical protein